MTTVRSFRVFSVAKVNALLYGILGLIFAPFLLIGPGLGMITGGGAQRYSGFGVSIFFAAILPFFYALIGFIMGGLMAFLYNAISRSVGGIEVELELPSPTIRNLSSVPAPAPVTGGQPPSRPEFE